MSDRIEAAIHAACQNWDSHFKCTYPECSCEKFPKSIKAALLAADAAGWQPIETAPAVLQDSYMAYGGGSIAMISDGMIAAVWHEQHTGRPTRWMPLPAPPGEQP